MSKEAMKLALKALKLCTHKYEGTRFQEWYFDKDSVKKSIKALEEALAKQEQGEPDYKTLAIQLQQQRTWVELTSEDKQELAKHHPYGSWEELCSTIEAKLKQKNT